MCLQQIVPGFEISTGSILIEEDLALELSPAVLCFVSIYSGPSIYMYSRGPMGGR